MLAIVTTEFRLFKDRRACSDRAESYTYMDAGVMLIEEVAALLKISRKQIERLERRGAFPIPRLAKLDRHARYPRALVQRFATGDDSLSKRRRR